MTLSTANVAVFAEFSWQPTELVQAEDRAHRMGQTRQVQVSGILDPRLACALSADPAPAWTMPSGVSV